MAVCQVGSHSAARGALQESFHYQVRLVNVLHGASILAYGCGYGADAHRTSAELVYYGQQYLVVYLVQSVAVYAQRTQCHLGYVQVYAAITLHLGKVTHSSQQSVGYVAVLPNDG